MATNASATGTTVHNDLNDTIEYPSKGNDATNMKVYGQAEHIEYTEEENKRVLRKIDLILLPMLSACYMFSVSSLDII